MKVIEKHIPKPLTEAPPKITMAPGVSDHKQRMTTKVHGHTDPKHSIEVN